MWGGLGGRPLARSVRAGILNHSYDDREVLTATTLLSRKNPDNGWENRRHGPNTVPANKLSEAERVEGATNPEYRDRSPKQISPARLCRPAHRVRAEACRGRRACAPGDRARRVSPCPAREDRSPSYTDSWLALSAHSVYEVASGAHLGALPATGWLPHPVLITLSGERS